MWQTTDNVQIQMGPLDIRAVAINVMKCCVGQGGGGGHNRGDYDVNATAGISVMTCIAWLIVMRLKTVDGLTSPGPGPGPGGTIQLPHHYNTVTSK